MLSASFLPHMNHVSVSPTDGNGPTQRQRKTLTRAGIILGDPRADRGGKGESKTGETKWRRRKA